MAEINQDLVQFLIGKTIATAVLAGCNAPNFSDEPCDGENTLQLTFTDGTEAEIIGSYGGYTGKSHDEYQEFLFISPCINRGRND